MASPNPSNGRAKNRRKPDPNSKAQGRSRLRRGILTASASIIAAAVVTAIATAIITPERVDALFRFGSSPSPATVPPTIRPIGFKEITNITGAISMSVPSIWAHIEGTYDVTYDGVSDKGAALVAGTNPQNGTAYGVDGVYLGDSSDTSKRLAISDWSASQPLSWETQQDDVPNYGGDGCILTARQLPAPKGWVIASRIWEDCEGKSGFSAYEMFGTPPDRSFVVALDMRSDTRTESSVFEHVARSIAVQPNLVPHAS
jgi:hypothetical protein